MFFGCSSFSYVLLAVRQGVQGALQLRAGLLRVLRLQRRGGAGSSGEEGRLLDQEALRKVLSELKMDTVMGKHEVDPATGMQLGIRGLLVQIQGGRSEIVWPDDLRNAEARVPAPGWTGR
jgi:hypothetical protein